MMVDMASKKIFQAVLILHSSSNENWFTFSTNTVLASKFPTDFNSTLLCFPTNCSKCCYIDKLFFNICHTLKILLNTQIPMYMSSVDLYKGQVGLALDKTGYISKETRPKFIDSQTFFHFHYKLFCIKAVHFSDKLSVLCPRIWPIGDICIGLYVLKRLLTVRYILAKSFVNATQFRRVFRKTKKSWIEDCWKFCS